MSQWGIAAEETRRLPQDGGLGEFSPARHERLLQTDPERYTELVRNITGFGIYLIDRDGRVRSWNLGAENLTGFLAEEVIGQPYATLFSDAAVQEGVPLKTLNFVRANRHCRDEQKRRRRDGQGYIAQCTVDAVRGESGELIGFVEVFHDITEQKTREERLYQRATRDPLTGVYNRGHFTELASQEIERARRFSEPLSLALLDIDHFKKVNDSHGHEVGDRTIQKLADTCSEFLRRIDFIGRLGGEEFAITLPRANKEPAFEMMQRLRLRLAEQAVALEGGRSLGFTVSIGIASLRPHTRDLAELLRNADAALYRAKREGRNRCEVWFD
ncbi:MAG TPA: sensor domain-containing diguanylate cyclase [Nevskiaceae bacterium]|nr:sensor domain-containing diguanylate cyclase [Nevskiaceae bacterium]